MITVGLTMVISIIVSAYISIVMVVSNKFQFLSIPIFAATTTINILGVKLNSYLEKRIHETTITEAPK
jgi:uncharacterized membrane protein (DUF485 family)